jgi:hypothetical protein
MPEQVPLLFTRLCELAEADGAVPEDGSGVDGVWTTTVPAPNRDREWNIALNADVDEDHVVEGFPVDGDDTDVPAARAAIHLGRMPAGVIGAGGGGCAVETLDDGPQSIEDELIDDIDAQIEALEAGDPDE